MRLVVARCEVNYTGRLTAVLPEAVRLLVFKADGSVLVHDDAGGYKPLNCIRTEFRPAVVKV
jgi:RecB family endonuclease NucS